MLLLIDKPKGITSHDVVDEVRRALLRQGYGRVKVGHAGTLDPMATGLLIVGVGRESTKLLGDLTKNTNKTYEAQITFGQTRTTDDAEGEVIKEYTIENHPSLETIKDVLKDFEGEQLQTPPQYSAIKLQGKKAYEFARAGEQVELNPRKITIHSIKLINYSYPTLDIICEVSSGTYIRSLARDIGDKLGCGGYLSSLRRSRIGEYDIKDAKQIDQL